jgi:hypothetical protein
MRRTAIALTLAAVTALAATPAQAHRRVPGFPSSCHFEGVVTFDPPLTGTPRQGRGLARASGTCDGRPATYRAWNAGLVSCAEGIATGAGRLRVGHRRPLRFRLEERRVVAGAELHLVARGGHTADGVAAASADEDPAAIAQACLTTGLRQTRVDIDLVASR